MTLANGNRYEGEFKDDKPSCQGVPVDADGRSSGGQCKDYKRDAEALCIDANGFRYRG